MEVCFPDVKKREGFCVTPAFTAVDHDGCEPAMCCKKKPVFYCCEKKPPKVLYCCDNKGEVYSCDKKHSGASGHSEAKPPKVYYCCDKDHPKVMYCCKKLPPAPPKQSCDESSKPVKTKYIMPCYRYEDGRINQPTVLMRRACEVACGRRKPFVDTSYHADADHEERRYHSEDGKGNLCFHYERKKPEPCLPTCSDTPNIPSSPCQTMCRPSERQFVPCMPANLCTAPNCCYYYVS